MDPYIRRDVWNLILRLKKQGKTVLLCSHPDAEPCDRG